MCSSPGKHSISLQDSKTFFKELDKKAREDLEVLFGMKEVGVQVDMGVEETGDKEKLGVLNGTKEVGVQVDMEVRERADQEVKVMVGKEEVVEGVEMEEDEDTL